MKINQVAKLTGVTVRTLHYYDQIGLLSPETVNDAGYREYDEENLIRLQQILLLRELEFSLKEIKKIISSPKYNRREALIKQRDLLTVKRERMDAIIKLLDEEIGGANKMSFKEFSKDEIEKCKKEYAAEVKERWGSSEAYMESEKKTAAYGETEWQQIDSKMQQLFKGFADIREGLPDSDEAQKLVKEWQDCITSNFYNCTDEILAGLGQMYVYDGRFKNNIDAAGEGTAQFIADAIEIYCKRKKG